MFSTKEIDPTYYSECKKVGMVREFDFTVAFRHTCKCMAKTKVLPFLRKIFQKQLKTAGIFTLAV